MKINVEIDLDWIEEGGNIDEEFKRQLIEGVKNSISRDVLKDAREKAKEACQQAVSAAGNEISDEIRKHAREYAENWLNNEVTVTDKYGDIVQSCKVIEIIKSNWEKLLESDVDSKGNFCDRYSRKTTLIKYLTGEHIKDVVGEELKSLKTDIDKSIKEHISKGIKESVADRFAEMVIDTAKNNRLLTSDIKSGGV
jgi:RNA processing factor Prp31